MQLLEYINSKVKLTPAELELLDKSCKTEVLKKGSLLMAPGNSNKKIIFVEKGLLRSFYIHKDKNITHSFFDENSILAALESIFYNTPDPYGREVIEESILRTIHFKDLTVLFNQIPGLKELAFMVSIHTCKLFSDRLFSLRFHTAKERYDDLLKNSPNILRRAPLGYIASYLGVSQQRLSVIRNTK